MQKKIKITRDKCKQSKPGCSLYDERAFNRYLLGAMTETEINRLEAHSENCDDCLRTLHRCHVAKEVEKDAEFVSRTKSLMDRIDN